MSLFLIVSAFIVLIVFLLAVIAIRQGSRQSGRRAPSQSYNDPHPFWMSAGGSTHPNHSQEYQHGHDASESRMENMAEAGVSDCSGSSSILDMQSSGGFDSGGSSSFDSGSSSGGSSGCD